MQSSIHQKNSKILRIPNMCFFQLRWLLSYQLFCDFSLNKSCNTYLEPVLSSGGRNWQLISTHLDGTCLGNSVISSQSAGLKRQTKIFLKNMLLGEMSLCQESIEQQSQHRCHRKLLPRLKLFSIFSFKISNYLSLKAKYNNADLNIFLQNSYFLSGFAFIIKKATFLRYRGQCL